MELREEDSRRTNRENSSEVTHWKTITVFENNNPGGKAKFFGGIVLEEGS